MEPERFDAAQLARVDRAARQAFDLVRRHYVLAPREVAQLDYRVCTLRDLSPEEVSDAALAQVLTYEQVRPGDERGHEVHRICLQDHRVLAREADGADLDQLLLYVLTHELIHVVRFWAALQQVDLAPRLRAGEEAAVDRTARHILARARRSGRPDGAPA